MASNQLCVTWKLQSEYFEVDLTIQAWFETFLSFKTAQNDEKKCLQLLKLEPCQTELIWALPEPLDLIVDVKE